MGDYKGTAATAFIGGHAIFESRARAAPSMRIPSRARRLEERSPRDDRPYPAARAARS